MAKRFKDKVALITGATSGIGQAISLRFAEEGAHVAINYPRYAENIRETEQEVERICRGIRQYGCRDFPVQGDVGNPNDVKKMFAQVLDQFSSIDVLVNNAGIQTQAPSDKLGIEEFDEVINVNLKGAFLCAQQAIRHFLKQNKPGVIINISSVHELIPKPEFLGYSVSKGGMGNLTRTLALEYAPQKIRINAIGPGTVNTPINQAWKEDPEKREIVRQHIPMGRIAEPEEIAAVAAFLSSDEAAYITGQTLYVDGGLTLYPDFRSNWSS